MIILKKKTQKNVNKYTLVVHICIIGMCQDFGSHMVVSS